jgi:hypothetical protein
MRAGLSRFTANADPHPPAWVLPQTEVILVLEGGVKIEIEGGPHLELKPATWCPCPRAW